MKLLLTSAGNTNKSIQNALLKLLGKPFKDARMVFVPTAANPEKGTDKWLPTDIRRFKELGFVAFNVIDISAVPKEEWLPIFDKADVFVFGGGDVYYLLQWMTKSGLRDLLPEFLKTKVYVGISAGSMVTAKVIQLSTHGILYYEKTGRLEKAEGLGFVNFELRPHLNSKFFPMVRIPELQKLAQETDRTFYALDDDSAIQVVDGEIAVISEGEWKKFH